MAVRDEAPANAFTTDGCSGGMSNIWRGLTATFPDLATDIGAHPPWESCCITHDQAYHIAGNATTARASFDARLTADETLRECVAATQTDLSPQTQQALADAMFHAVRTGGGPCTGLPWRWGYGLPRCIGFFQ
ncbi:MAG: hypothetical protein CR993_05790 [Rhodobacterales bacterium]|nr:MAG: hypothetical protein CR993_05790 [Rhodobacterales bacterium]